MNVYLLVAAAVLFFVGIMHTVLAEWGGARRLVRRITQSEIFDSSDTQDLLARQIVRLAWHLTSLSWCGIASALAFMSFSELTESRVIVVRIFGLTFLLHSVLSLVLARGKHPSWYLFLIVSAFCFLATISPGP